MDIEGDTRSLLLEALRSQAGGWKKLAESNKGSAAQKKPEVEIARSLLLEALRSQAGGWKKLDESNKGDTGSISAAQKKPEVEIALDPTHGKDNNTLP